MEGPELSVVMAPDASLVTDVTTLLDRAARATGHVALSEHKRNTLLAAAGGAGAMSGEPHFIAGVLARSGALPDVVAYASVVGDTGSRQYAVELVVEPTAEDPGALKNALVDASTDLVIGLGGGTLRLWVFQASDSDDALAEAHGFNMERNLLQMRCPLPLPVALPLPQAGPDRVLGRGPSIQTRPFRPGLDEAAWLATNNRAFAGHPEQGHWDLATLMEREKEPWFDPRGLLLLEEDGRVAGSCWTKVHSDTDPPMGEIYVIGVDPDFHGRGWGRSLTQAGLDWLSSRGLTTGMLYVDADNVAAVSLYRSMGFVENHVDRAYVGHFGVGHFGEPGPASVASQPTPIR
jgi:mycothiol synthase